MKECWALEPGSPQTTGQVSTPAGLSVAGHGLAQALHRKLLQVGWEGPQR